MKKVLVVLLALLIVVGGMAACGDDDAAYDDGAGVENTAPAANDEDDGAQEDEPAADEAQDDDYGLVETEDGYYQEFQFINSTGQTLVEMYASAGGANQWGDNLLGDATVGPDMIGVLNLYIIPGDTTDLRIVGDNGAEHELRGYQLEGFSTLELVANEDGSAVVELS